MKSKGLLIMILLLLAVTLLFSGCGRRVARQTTTITKGTESTIAKIDVSKYGSGDYNLSLEGYPGRDYRIYVPKSYDGSRAMPVIMLLHGGGGTPGNVYQLTCPDTNVKDPKCLNNMAEREKFIVVYPAGNRNPNIDGDVRTFNAGGGKKGYACVSGYACKQGFDDVSYFKSLLNDLSKNYKIDSKRVYATGISNGAAMSNRIACEMSDKIAAIAPVAFGNQISVSDSCNPSRAVPVIEFHGTGDPFAAYEGGKVNPILFSDFGNIIPVEDSVADWAKRNGCNEESTKVSLPDKVDDGTSVEKISYGGCKDNADVVLYKITNGGHTWPDGLMYTTENKVGKITRDVNANELMWQFFKQHPMK